MISHIAPHVKRQQAESRAFKQPMFVDAPGLGGMTGLLVTLLGAVVIGFALAGSL